LPEAPPEGADAPPNRQRNEDGESRSGDRGCGGGIDERVEVGDGQASGDAAGQQPAEAPIVGALRCDEEAHGEECQHERRDQPAPREVVAAVDVRREAGWETYGAGSRPSVHAVVKRFSVSMGVCVGDDDAGHVVQGDAAEEVGASRC
jgi:hypothetical protein